MDKFDHKIIDILRHNARLSVTEIAEKVNLSRSAVTARIRKLENDKVILGYHAEIAPPEEDSICAYFALKFDTSISSYYCESYADELYKIDGVKWCHAISGETDMMVFVEVPNMNRLNEIRDQIQRFPELRHLMTHTVLTEFFNTTGNKFVK
ncbi:Lrp/AsnC family transcriptional regulator [Vibrio parahaemolyticus]|uniref:Lrp/AsnC family transcriptional regulator n=1 Tax=Vibrio parahaemolyticus TaxID=670 RepID=UPI0004186F4E|nr:Lrp/AsnC family transcriptional regulator [Vibrio parahaemolyticus]EGQ8412511.1 AsnC family transcriptional regulator [Vibrio parahaemolyticus]EGQ9446680.1 Lrp/AsnC family transcriptional regulator [Vibrio parahaemolyticus]EGQ9533028.1 Lrp/AsnC family transcriptional regulator [Vibrio parahaemolyticus]EHY0971122.1 Lrp/AsnC family transcriptional regulator [Vibrio parahaemolyticus]EHZ7336275.1 Lrp/AsnC family transcriptional regulator [Vibrio parahaemolyticus]